MLLKVRIVNKLSYGLAFSLEPNFEWFPNLIRGPGDLGKW
jgi:hypothetical protein